MKTYILLAFTLVLPVLACNFSLPAMAQDTPDVASPPLSATVSNGDLLPVKSADEANVTLDEANPTHPAIKMTPDKSELIRLSRPASAVIVGNPAHLTILPEGNDTLVLVPKAPGATYFTVLDKDNKVLMQRHVLVAAPEQKYVRIRKSCAGSNKCQPTAVYYCPDMCHEIILNAGGESKSTGSGSEKGTNGGSSSSGDETSSANSNSDGHASSGGEETSEE